MFNYVVFYINKRKFDGIHQYRMSAESEEDAKDQFYKNFKGIFEINRIEEDINIKNKN